jgi:release factor glutamine methyltransferase
MAEAWTPLAVLEWTGRRFSEAGIENPRLDAQILLAHGLGCDRVHLYTQFDKPLRDAELARCRELVKRRLAREPVAYLVGRREFWSIDFEVDGRVLIPRPETETLVGETLARISDRDRALLIADVGTGSGVLAISLLRELPRASMVATDVSAEAVEVAKSNAERLGVADRISFRIGDLCEAFAPGTRFDVIVSNPPYVTTSECKALAPEVQREPKLALDGGASGLVLLERLIRQAGAFLAPGGWLGLEHGNRQAEAVAGLFAREGFKNVTHRKDLAGHDRVSFGQWSL